MVIYVCVIILIVIPCLLFSLLDQTDFHLLLNKRSKPLFPYTANSLGLHKDGKGAKLYLEHTVSLLFFSYTHDHTDLTLEGC